MESNKHIKQPVTWRGLFYLTFLCSFGYVFLEWLFVVTMPSFLTNVSWLVKFEILVFVSASAISISFLLVSCFFLVAQIIQRKQVKKLIFNIASLVPAIILACLTLILIDNFTYTIFDFGIIKTTGAFRGFYGIGFVGILYLFHRKIYSWCKKIGRLFLTSVIGWKIAIITTIVLLILILGPVLKTVKNFSGLNDLLPNNQSNELPNILIITSDGLNADHMSIYGYEKATTPFLNERAQNALVVENNFNNNARTGGSIISILTGKYPSTTRVIFSPDILRNENSYQHLPGILKSLGYYTAQYGGHTFNYNLLQGFEEINGRPAIKNSVLDVMDDYIPGDFAYFSFEILNRIADRLRHIFFIKKMDDSLLHLLEWDGNFSDYDNLNKLFSLMENTSSPWFVQMHWLGTHGDYFKVRNQVFSLGKDPDHQEAWDQDFYDDAILEFDEVLRGIEEKLDDLGKLNNTVVVVGSDHGQFWKVNERIPLIFLFPEGEYAQEIIYNGQNLDIAPTLLDYLGIEKPAWMKGDSLLDRIENQRLILSFDLGVTTEGEFGISNDPDYSVPPFYQFGKISAIDCDRFYSLSLRNGFRLEKGLIKGYDSPCKYVYDSDEQILHAMLEHLKENRFDTSTLKSWIEDFLAP